MAVEGRARYPAHEIVVTRRGGDFGRPLSAGADRDRSRNLSEMTAFQSSVLLVQ